MIERFGDFEPVIAPDAWVHPSAVVLGDVRLGPRVNVWPGVVLRGDQGCIEVGEETNLQDGTIAHSTGGWSTVRIGARVTVGHRVILHGCQVADDALVGMGSILLDNCSIGAWSIVGAGALVPAGMVVPEGVLVLGSPARVVRPVTEKDRAMIRHGHATYLGLAAQHLAGR